MKACLVDQNLLRIERENGICRLSQEKNKVGDYLGAPSFAPKMSKFYSTVLNYMNCSSGTTPTRTEPIPRT